MHWHLPLPLPLPCFSHLAGRPCAGKSNHKKPRTQRMLAIGCVIRTAEPAALLPHSTHRAGSASAASGCAPDVHWQQRTEGTPKLRFCLPEFEGLA